MTSLLLAATLTAAVTVDGFPLPRDREYREALEVLYNGGTDTALARLAALGRQYPDDPAGSYLEALALCWKIEERPEVTELDAELERRVERTLAIAARRLALRPVDLRARLGRAGAHGVASRHALFRGRELRAAREAVRMREELLSIQESHPDLAEVKFGLGLYDYYADVLPRALKLFRFLAGFPGGDRERGLALIRGARDETVLHDIEAQVQLYEINALYEDRPEDARSELTDLRHRFPASPLWALQLLALLRDDLGDYGAAVDVGDEILAAAEGGHPHFGPAVETMARLGKVRALILDLRLEEADRELALLATRPSPLDRLDSRAQWLAGRLLELRGERSAAVGRYQRAAQSSSRVVGDAALEALREPLPAEQVAAVPALAAARRAYERDDQPTAVTHFAEVLRLWPDSAEARLALAEADLRCGRIERASDQLQRVPDHPEGPPWLVPWKQLLLAWLLDTRGERTAAEDMYREVARCYRGRTALRERALRGLAHPYAPQAPCVSRIQDSIQGR